MTFLIEHANDALSQRIDMPAFDFDRGFSR